MEWNAQKNASLRQLNQMANYNTRNYSETHTQNQKQKRWAAELS